MIDSELEERVTTLETRLAFQDQTLEQLHEALLEQQQRLDVFELETRRLRARLEARDQSPSASTADKPPHY